MATHPDGAPFHAEHGTNNTAPMTADRHIIHGGNYYGTGFHALRGEAGGMRRTRQPVDGNPWLPVGAMQGLAAGIGSAPCPASVAITTIASTDSNSSSTEQVNVAKPSGSLAPPSSATDPILQWLDSVAGQQPGLPAPTHEDATDPAYVAGQWAAQLLIASNALFPALRHYQSNLLAVAAYARVCQLQFMNGAGGPPFHSGSTSSDGSATTAAATTVPSALRDNRDASSASPSDRLSTSDIPQVERIRRPRFSVEVQLALQAAFKTNVYPSSEQLTKLARTLGEDNKRVRVWFNNQRANSKANNRAHAIALQALHKQKSSPGAAGFNALEDDDNFNDDEQDVDDGDNDGNSKTQQDRISANRVNTGGYVPESADAGHDDDDPADGSAPRVKRTSARLQQRDRRSSHRAKRARNT